MKEPAPCPFCFPAEDRIAFEDRLTRALWDAFPVSEGHLLIVPRRHVPTCFDAAEEERAAITRAIDRGRELIESRHHPDGFDIGASVGEAAGQTVFHLHVHLIPRSKGDVAADSRLSWPVRTRFSSSADCCLRSIAPGRRIPQLAEPGGRASH
jgi:diadenosine tetraphosphate (Ap4A) HIT family hydrolase